MGSVLQQPQVHKFTSFTQKEPTKEVEVQRYFPKLLVSPMYPLVLKGSPELFQEVGSPEQVPLASPLFQKPSEIPFVLQSLEEIIAHTLDELDLRFFDGYFDEDSRPVTDPPLFQFSNSKLK